MRPCDCIGNAANQIEIRDTGFGKTVNGLALIEAGHFDRIFNRCTVAVDAQGSILTPGYRNHAMIDLRRERLVDFDFLFAGGLALRQRRIIQKREANCALDFQRARAGEKYRSRVSVDPMNRAMRREAHQKRKDLVLGAGLLCV